MTEKELDFKKIQHMIGKCTPQQLGGLMKQYSEKHLSTRVQIKNDVQEIVEFFGAPITY